MTPQLSRRLRLAGALALLGWAPVLAQSKSQTAVFAGGCYWTMQHDMQRVKGVRYVRAGFTPFPPGDAAAAGKGHAPSAFEAVEVTYDPRRISYRQLVASYFRMIDPTDPGGAFCDRGANYRSAIFTDSADQVAAAGAEKQAAAAVLKRPVVTAILPRTGFHAAPPDQQNWSVSHAVAYASYRSGCGKDRRIKALWGAAAAG